MSPCFSACTGRAAKPGTTDYRLAHEVTLLVPLGILGSGKCTIVPYCMEACPPFGNLSSHHTDDCVDGLHSQFSRLADLKKEAY